MRTLPPDRGPDLRHLLGRTEPVEARHQRCVQACWHRYCGRRHRGNGFFSRALALNLKNCFCHLLDEQWNSVCAFNYILPDTRREDLVADDAVDYCAYLALSQPIDGDSRDIGATYPRRLELGAKCHEQQHPQCPYSIHRPPEHFQGCGVSPLRILENHQYWISPRECLHLREQRFQRPLPELLCRQFDR